MDRSRSCGGNISNLDFRNAEWKTDLGSASYRLGLWRGILRNRYENSKTLMGKTSIEWTDASWNPIVGCTEVSPGCANCYAARLAATRLKHTPQYSGLAILPNGGVKKYGDAAQESGAPRWTGEARFLPKVLEEPLHWKQPRRIFVCDMGDLFHESVQDGAIDSVFAVILKTPQHTYQILTKRAERMRKYFSGWGWWTGHPLPNVWLGVSVENQHFADERIPLLLATPAAVRWISAEPLLGPLEITAIGRDGRRLLGIYPVGAMDTGASPKLDWVVCGGESGPNARPMHPDWARVLRDQCQAASVPFFFKQWGEWLPGNEYSADQFNRGVGFQRVGKKRAGRLLDGREWNEFPRIRSGCES